MANKARYYGIATREQQDLKGRATRNPVINKQELTAYSVYSAMAQIPNADKLSAQMLAARVKEIIMASGFNGTITAAAGKVSDGVNTFALTKNKTHGFHIGEETHDDTKRKR